VRQVDQKADLSFNNRVIRKTLPGAFLSTLEQSMLLLLAGGVGRAPKCGTAGPRRSPSCVTRSHQNNVHLNHVNNSGVGDSERSGNVVRGVRQQLRGQC
jgi:hypothetical protein